MAVNESTLIRRSENVREPDSDATLIDRVRYLITRMRKTQQQFAALLGIDGPNLSRILNGHAPFTDSMINRIVVNLGVSKEWLLTGKEVPFAKNPTIDFEIFGTGAEEKSLSPVPVAQGAPVYDIDATAGFSELSAMFTDEHVIGFLQLPQISSENVVVRVSGNSMSPNIPDGSYISIRQINANGTIFWGQTYLVVLEDYRVVKILRKHPDPAKVILHSINKSFDDVEINRTDIKALYIVDSVISCKILS